MCWYMGSAVQSRNSWVVRWTIQDGWLGGPQGCRATPVIFQNTCLEYFTTQPHSFESSRDLREMSQLKLSEFRPCFSVTFIDGILPKGPCPPCLRMAHRALLAWYPRYMKRRQRKIFWKFISHKMDYLTCKYGSPVMFMGRIWWTDDRLWTALMFFVFFNSVTLYEINNENKTQQLCLEGDVQSVPQTFATTRKEY